MAIRQVLTEAFAREDAPVPPEVGLVEALRDSDAWLPELSMLAEVGGDVVAHALLTRVTVGDEAFPALALGPVAVLPRGRGLGYGSDVVQAGLDEATELGERLVLVLGDPGYYRRFGFEPAARFGLTSPWSSAGDHWQALVLPDAVSGGAQVPAGEVHYPAPWASL